MVDSFGNLVVRPHAPRRRAVLIGLAVLLAVAILYTAFELGRYDAGFRVVDSVRGALSASSRIRNLEKENERQRTQLAAAEVARRVDQEGYKLLFPDLRANSDRTALGDVFYDGFVEH